MRRITKWAVGIGVGYGLYLVSVHHFVYFGGGKVRLLRKEQPTLARTFFSTELKKPETILKDDVLRKAGIADLLVEEGLLSEARRDYLMEQYEQEEAD